MQTSLNPLQARVSVEFKHPHPLIGCRFDPTGRYLFVSSEDSTLQRYDLATGRKTAFAGHPSWVRGMAFAGTGRVVPSQLPAVTGLGGSLAAAALARATGPITLISGDYHGYLRWWDAASDQPTALLTVTAHEGWVRAVATSADGKFVASCGNDGLVKLWSAADGSPIREFTGHGCHVYNVAFHPNGKTLVSADLKGVVKEWDLATGKHFRDLDAKVLHKYDSGFAADIGGIRSMAFSADGSSLLCSGITNVSNAFAGIGNPLVVQFDWKDGKAKHLKPAEAYQGTGWGVGLLANGWVVGAGGAGDGRIWFWKPGDLSSTHTVKVPASCRDMAVHPDGAAVAVAAHTGATYVYTVTPAPVAAKK